MQSWDTRRSEGRESLAWQRGNHSLKFGAAVPQVYLADVGVRAEPRPTINSPAATPRAPPTDDGTGSALASYLLELPAVRQRQVGSPHMNLRQWYADAFVQDTWRLSPHTTLNLGLRYEYMSPLHDISNDWAGLFVSPSDADRLYRRPNGHAQGTAVHQQAAFRAAIRHCAPGAQDAGWSSAPASASSIRRSI